MTLPTVRTVHVDVPGSHALPGGTEVGDALLLWGWGVPLTVDDERFTFHKPHSFTDNDDFVSAGGFWIGTADTLDPVDTGGGVGSGARGYGAILATISGRVRPALRYTFAESTSEPYAIEPVGGVAAGTLILSIGQAGIGGTVLSFVTGGADWTITGNNFGYHAAAMASTDDAKVTDPVTLDWFSGFAFASLMVQVNPVTGHAPPCRQFPGGIQGTVGGAVRQFPRPKYRQVGGWGTY